MRQVTRLALVIAGLFVLTGCTDTIANLTMVSTKTTDFSKQHTRAASQASASDGRLWILILPLGGKPSIDVAVNELLTKHNGDYLTDAKIEDSGWSLLAISYGSISVKGDVWTATPPMAAPPASTPAPAPMTK